MINKKLMLALKIRREMATGMIYLADYLALIVISYPPRSGWREKSIQITQVYLIVNQVVKIL